ncbi:MAG: glycosyltransferase family 39 protein [Chthoniobacterales bacterium]
MITKVRWLRDYFGFATALEFWAAAFFLVAQLPLKLWNIFHYRFDSDESQHLHVVWGWTRGFVQYRDLFDNHMPLFQLICAPVLGVMGEHARDLYWMRGLMLPLYLVSLWAVYRIGEKVFSRRVGIWSAILMACYSEYHLCTTEFRTDNLWTTLWLLCLLVLVSGAFSIRRALVSGLLLGLCFGVSLKSTLMLLTIVTAAAMAVSLVGWAKLNISWPDAAKSTAAFLSATATVPLSIIIFFAAKGIWPAMRYCVFEHNVLTHPASTRTYLHLLILPVALPLLIFGARRIFRNQLHSGRAFRPLFLLFVGCAYYLLLQSLWGHITRQDYLPFYPIAALITVAGLSAIPRRWPAFRLTSAFPVPAVAVLLFAIFNLWPRIAHTNNAAREVGLVREVLKLTEPNDYVFDRKGETVFRRRAFYYVLEGLTRERLRRGLIPDNARERCVETRTCLAVIGKHMPLRDEHFITANYLRGHGRVRVAGYLLHAAPQQNEIDFNVAIPAEYKLVTTRGTASGLLDGTPFDQPRFLAAGQHHFRLTSPGSRIAVVWAQAAERNFSPFGRHRNGAHHRA